MTRSRAESFTTTPRLLTFQFSKSDVCRLLEEKDENENASPSYAKSIIYKTFLVFVGGIREWLPYSDGKMAWRLQRSLIQVVHLEMQLHRGMKAYLVHSSHSLCYEAGNFLTGVGVKGLLYSAKALSGKIEYSQLRKRPYFSCISLFGYLSQQTFTSLTMLEDIWTISAFKFSSERVWKLWLQCDVHSMGFGKNKMDVHIFANLTGVILMHVFAIN